MDPDQPADAAHREGSARHVLDGEPKLDRRTEWTCVPARSAPRVSDSPCTSPIGTAISGGPASRDRDTAPTRSRSGPGDSRYAGAGEVNPVQPHSE
jgi:hypothetical protein